VPTTPEGFNYSKDAGMVIRGFPEVAQLRSRPDQIG